MKNPFTLRTAPPPPPGADRRMRGRVLQQGVMSNLGIVIDLSAGGMRVMCTRPQEGQVDVTITAADESITLRGTVVWSRKAGFRRHMLGVRFLNVESGDLRRLASIATAHRLHEAI